MIARLYHALKPFLRLVLSGALVLVLLLSFWQAAVPAAISRPDDYLRVGGYGISVANWLDPRPDLLNQMNMDWVKVYDQSQVRYYPNQKVLYWLQIDGYPEDWEIDGWTQGLYRLANELEALGVDAVEIGNEPNLAVEWGGQTPNPEAYVDLLRRAYTAFKREAPGIIVVSAGLSPVANTPDGEMMEDMAYAQRMLNAGAASYFDAFGYHPYGMDQPPEANPYAKPFSFRRTELMRNLLVSNGVTKPIWITEFGWVRNPAEDGVNCANSPLYAAYGWAAVDAQTQARYTRRAYEFSLRNWAWAGPMFLWNLNWNLYDEGYEPMCSHLRWYSILDRNGRPLPVFEALKTLPPPPKPEIPGGEPPLADFRPELGAVLDSPLTRVREAGCAGILKMGSFRITLDDAPRNLLVEVQAANAPGRPPAWTSVAQALNDTQVDVYVDATDVDPGLYLIAVNLRAQGTDRLTTKLLRGWLLLHHPSSPECVAAFEGSQ